MFARVNEMIVDLLVVLDHHKLDQSLIFLSFDFDVSVASSKSSLQSSLVQANDLPSLPSDSSTVMQVQTDSWTLLVSSARRFALPLCFLPY